MKNKLDKKIVVDFLAENSALEFVQLVDLAVGEINNLNIEDSNGWIKTYIANRNNSLTYPSDVFLVNEYLPKQASICECGAAPFILTKALNLQGYEVTGIDIAPERFSHLEKLGLNIVKCNVDKEALPFEECQFEAVIFNELFEHLRENLIFTMQEVYRILRPGGLLFLSTPNLKNLVGVVNFLIKSKSYSCAGNLFHEWNKINTIGHMGHVREYTAFEVSDFLSNLGFQTSKIIYRGRYESMNKKLQIMSIPFRVIPNLKSWLKPNFTIVAEKPNQ